MDSGTLYIVATPIGNLEDITLRALRVLKEVSVIYAEDTRVTGKLLQRYEIKNKLSSYREAAPANLVGRTIAEIEYILKNGEDVAYVSDAGTPGVSDPGAYLVAQIVAAGFKVVPIPGVSALATLLSASGSPIIHPLFIGFLPKKKGHQTLMLNLKELLNKGVVDGLVFYESPERIVKLLSDLLTWDMPLWGCIGRELTKMYEEINRGKVEELLTIMQSKNTIKGEISLLITKE